MTASISLEAIPFHPKVCQKFKLSYQEPSYQELQV